MLSRKIFSAALAAAAETGRLILFHHDPAYSDEMLAGMERTAQSRFADSITAYEGLEVYLHPVQKMAMRLQPAATARHRHGEAS